MTDRPAPASRQRQPAHQPPRCPEAALTEVVSTFLMLGIAVGFAAGFSLLLLALPGPQPEPHLTLGTFILPTATDTLVLEHRGGRDLPLRTMVVSLNVGGALVTANLGARLDAADPAWQVVDANGVPRTSAQSFRPGDQVRFTDASIRGVATTLSVLDEGRGSLAMASAVVNQADTTRPQVSSARTTSTTTLQVNFTEALASVAAGDFTVAGHTISTAVLLGDGTAVELTVNAMTTSETPLVSVVASPTGTRDLANNLVLGGGSATPADGIAPGVSAVVTVTGNTTAFVNWTSSETATGWLDYGPDQLYGLGAATPSGTTHSASLTGLTPTTVYHFKIRAIDAAGNNLTTEPDRTFLTQDLNGTGGGGGGGGGGTVGDGLGDPPPHFFALTGVPGILEPGVASAAVTITLRNTTGAAVTPASAVTVNLTTNSTAGYFLDGAGTSVVTNVSISGGSTVQFRYVDLRSGGPSLLLASAQNVTAGSAVVSIVPRGNLKPQAGQSTASVVVNTIYVAEQDRDENATMGLNILNPTAAALTITSITISASPALEADFFEGTIGKLPGTDSNFTGCNTWSGSGSDTITCTTTTGLPAFGMRQFLFYFTTADAEDDDNTVLTATVSFASGSPVTGTFVVRNEGSNNQALHVELLALSAAGGQERAGFPGVTGGSSTLFNFRFDLKRDSGTMHTKFHIPAGWQAVSVPAQSALNSRTASVRQPTANEPGWVLLGSVAGDFDFQFSATPPDITGLDVIHAEVALDPQSSGQNEVATTLAFGVAIV